jgi:hypothetical protein
MRIFVYKTLFVLISIFILFKILITTTINKYEDKIDLFTSKENISNFKSAIKKELNESIKKDRILNEEDAKLLNQIFKKIKLELQNSE